jgi:hypothetical protein
MVVERRHRQRPLDDITPVTIACMDIVEIAIPTNEAPAILIEQIERCAMLEGLDIGVRMTLRSFPGSMHWHLRLPSIKGVLELTYWPEQRRLWFAVHANRQAEWIAPAIQRLRACLEQAVA